MKKTKTNPQTNAVNAAIERASRALNAAASDCASSGSPIKSITFRVLDKGNTRLHVIYRRRVKKR